MKPLNRRDFLKLLGIGTTTYVTIGTGLWKPPTEVIDIRKSFLYPNITYVDNNGMPFSGIIVTDVYEDAKLRQLSVNDAYGDGKITTWDVTR